MGFKVLKVFKVVRDFKDAMIYLFQRNTVAVREVL